MTDDTTQQSNKQTEENQPVSKKEKKEVAPPPSPEQTSLKEEPVEKIVESPPADVSKTKPEPTLEPTEEEDLFADKAEKTEPEKIPVEPEIKVEPEKVEEKVLPKEDVKIPIPETETPKPTSPSAKATEDMPPAPAQPKIVGIPENHLVIPFMAQFLNKLKEFRGRANQKRSENVEKNLALIMEFARETQKVTNDDVERLTGVKDAQAQRYLKKLVEDKKLVRFGRTNTTFYKPVK